MAVPRGNNYPGAASRPVDSKCVNRWWPHRTAVACKELVADLERAVLIDVAARACCCPARPVVTVVMPPTASRPHPVDLLLCGHHFRVSQAALRAAGAAARRTARTDRPS